MAARKIKTSGFANERREKRCNYSIKRGLVPPRYAALETIDEQAHNAIVRLARHGGHERRVSIGVATDALRFMSCFD
jgi:hypothetical protein